MLYFVPIPCGALTNLTGNVAFFGGEDVTMCTIGAGGDLELVNKTVLC